MNFLKLRILVLFGLITGMCVNYAQSATLEILEWRSTSLLGGCHLTVEVANQSDVSFIPSTESKTRFPGVWPTRPDKISVEAPDETLSIRFDMVGGELQPVSYVYDNLRLREASRGHTQPKTCPSLQRVR